jgi:hypothetical protein
MKNHKCKFMRSWSDEMINTREIAKEYRLAHWSQIMRERSESGLSIKAYCERAGMHQNVYHYWQRKLREAAVIAAAGSDTARETNLPMTVPQGWAVCTTEKEPQEQDAVVIEIGRSRILAKETTNPEVLAKVCKVLMSIC